MAFSYIKNISAILVPFAFMFCFWLISLAFLLFCSPLYTPAEYWLSDLYKAKEIRLENLNNENTNSLFICSGSNSLFSFSTEVLEQNLPYNVHNLGTSVSMSLDFHLNYVKQFLKQGDIIIFPLEFEYPLLDEEEYNGALFNWTYNNFTTWGRDYMHLLPHFFRKEILKRNLTTYWSRLPTVLKPLPVAEKEIINDSIKNREFTKSSSSMYPSIPYSLEGFNKYGEILCDGSIPITENKEFTIPSKATSYFLKVFNAFKTYSEENGIKFYFTYPVSINQPSSSSDDPIFTEKLNLFEKIYQDAGFSFFGTKEFYNLEEKYFYDSRYHLNATGAILRSLLFIEDFNTAVLDRKPSFDNSSETERNDFILKKKQEAQETIEQWRMNAQEK